jgi:nicotinamidase-related amidase
MHPDRCVSGEAGEYARQWRDGVSLLAATRTMFAISPVVVGERDAAMEIVGAMDDRCVSLDVDPLTIWQTEGLPSALRMDEAGILFIAGAWLEEDVLLAAVRAASVGYDVRLLVDLSRSRRESEGQLVVHRAAMHGILVVTLRQALLEWATFTDDNATIARVRALLA